MSVGLDQPAGPPMMGPPPGPMPMGPPPGPMPPMSMGGPMPGMMPQIDPMTGQPLPPPSILGPPPPGVGPWTHLWMMLVSTDDVSQIASEFDYRVEAASSRKPNRDKMVADLNDLGQLVVPIVQPMIMANPANLEWFNWFMGKTAEARDMEPPPKLLPPAAPPMPPQGAAPPGPPPPNQGPPQ